MLMPSLGVLEGSCKSPHVKRRGCGFSLVVIACTAGG